MSEETETSVSELHEAQRDEAGTEDPQAEDAQPGHPQADEELAVPLAELRPSLEAVLMVADQPLDQVTLASAVGYPVGEVRAALDDLAREYAEQGRGFELRNVAGGWRYYTREEYAAVVEGFVLDGQQARLTQAALETLSVVAYKQPISRARVSAIRGVNVDGVMRTLLTRGLVEEAGQDGETGANLYQTTSYFLERIGVTAITDLPELAPFLPDMDDMEDDLAALAGGNDPAEAAEAVAAAEVDPVVDVPLADPDAVFDRHAAAESDASSEPDAAADADAASEPEPEPVVEVEMSELGVDVEPEPETGADAAAEPGTDSRVEAEPDAVEENSGE